MPFTLGFYDLFSYLIPGMLYLYVINEAMRLTAVCRSLLFPGFVLPPEPEYRIAAIVGFLVLAYLTGHIFDFVARWLVFGLRYQRKTSQKILDAIRKRDTSVNIQFESKDWHVLLITLRQRNLSVAQTFDKYNADSIMFRNISLIAFFMGVIMLFRAYFETPTFLIAVAFAIIILFISAHRSREFLGWFFEGIFLASLEYGKSVSEVLEQDKMQSLEHLVRFNLSRNKGGKE